MTTAGSISLGVDIDASDLRSELTREVIEQMGPVLAELNTELRKNAEAHNTAGQAADRNAQKQIDANNAIRESTRGMNAEMGQSVRFGQNWSNTVDRNTVPAARRQRTEQDRLSESTKRVTKAQDEFSTALDLFGKGSPEAVAAYRRLQSESTNYRRELAAAANASRNSSNSIIDDYRRMADAADRARISQERAARIGGIDTGGGGGGRIGGGGRGGRWSWLGGPGGMALGGLTAQALAPATLAVTNLAGAIVQLGQAGLVLPGIFAGGLASIGTAVIGFQGLGDAIKAVNKGMAEGASKADLKKMTAALKDMDDNAKELVLTIATDFLPAFKKLQSETVQHNMFDGISKSLMGLKDRALPTVTRGLEQTSKAWNDTFKRAIGAAGDTTNLSLLDRIFGNAAEGQKRANQAIAPMTHAVLALSSAGSDFLPRLGSGVEKVMTRFDNWVSKNTANGQMWKWIDEGLNGFRALGNSVLNFGKMLTGLVKATGGDGGFLGWLEKTTGKWQKFINSTEGQNKLAAWARDAKDAMRDWGPILKDLMKLVGDVVDGFKTWGAVVLPVLSSITHALASMPNLVSAAVTAFAAFKTVKGLGSLMGLAGPAAAAGAAGAAGGGGLLSRIGTGVQGAWLTAMAGATPAEQRRMMAMQRAAQGARAFGGRLIAPATLIGAGGLALGASTQQDARTGAGALLGAGTTIGSSTLIGASLGSVVPGVGTAIGAGLGALAGSGIAIYNEAVRHSNETARAAAAAQQKLADAQEHAAATSDAARSTNRDINQALINSGGKIDQSTVLGVTDAINQLPDQIKDEVGQTRADSVAKLLKTLNIRPDQLAGQVTGEQGIFDALNAQLGTQGQAGQDLAASLINLRQRTFGQAATAATANPLLQAGAGDTGKTLDMVANDLHTLVGTQGKGGAFNVNAIGGADLLKQLQGMGLPVSAGQNGAIQGALTPDQFKQLAAASGVPIIPMPSGGIGIPAAPVAAPPVLGALPNQQKQDMANLAAAAAGVPLPPQSVVPPSGINLGALTPPGLPAVGGPQSGLDVTKQQLGDISKTIADMPAMRIPVDSPDVPKTAQDLGDIKGQMDGINGTGLVIKADTSQADQAIKSLFAAYQSKTITVNVGVNPAASGGAPGHADGGVIPGYSPGVDNTLRPMSGGEGIIIPEAMRALGGSWLYNLNSSFRPGISRRGYATGGIVGAGDGVGDPLGDNSVIGLLTQIRDALVGRGGGSTLATIADNTGQVAQAVGPKMKPFGGDVAKGALAGMIKGLGGDPNLMDWGGFNGEGQMLAPRGPAAGLGGANAANVATITAALQAFARSGDVSGLGGVGLNVNSPVVGAITSARNKKKGMGDDDIAALVGQVLTGGGFDGVLDAQNTPLIKSLTKYQNQLMTGKAGRTPALTGAVAPGGFDQALLSQVPAGKYTQSQADLTQGLADCSSSVEDLVNLMDGAPTGGRSLSTANAPEWFAQHGFVPGTMPGAFNVGFNNQHMQATLPDGTPFNWGSDAAAARGGVGGTGAFDPAFTQQYYRPVSGMPVGAPSTGITNPLGYGGGPVPVYIVDGPGAAFGKQLAGQIGEGVIDATAQPLSDVAGSIITGIDQGTQLERDSTKNRPATSTKQLMTEGNPLSVAALAGYKVPDFSRRGGDGAINANTGPGYTAGGQMLSDTASLIQRTFTDMEAANDARQQQMMAVLDQIKTQLSEQVLKPMIQSAVTAAIQAAGSSAGGGMQMPGLADGGPISGGISGVDSVPALLMPGEHVLTTADVGRMGGQAGVYNFRRSLYRNGGMVHFATGGGVNANKTVGADFFGLSQVPVIGTIINLLVNILLQIIGVNIEAADTLTEISSSFDQFRGDFKRFDATGRLASDTSALSDRSGSSQEKAIDERVRIFKAVLTGLIKFIIQKIIIPITQAVMQTLLSTASSAVSGAITGGVAAAGGGPAGAIAGNLVGGLMNSAGGAAINIGGELFSAIADAATGPIIDLLTGGLKDMFGGLLAPILSGGIGGLISMFLPFLAFDSGGIAEGTGMMPKAVIAPERVLSPRQTRNHERLTDVLDGGILDRLINGSGGTTVQIHAPFTVMGNEQGGRVVRNQLLSMMT